VRTLRDVSAPTALGDEFGWSEGYGYYDGGYGGHPAQGYGGGMGMGHSAHGGLGPGLGCDSTYNPPSHTRVHT